MPVDEEPEKLLWKFDFDYTQFASYDKLSDAYHATGGTNKAAKLKIGMVQDWGLGIKPVCDQYDAVAMAFDEAYERGWLPAPVELHLREVDSVPYGSYKDAEDAWLELVDLGCLATIGPHTSMVTPTLRHVADKREVPIICNSETIHSCSDWVFDLPNGTFPDESFYMARYLVEKGARRVGVIHENNNLGEEYWDYFKLFSRQLGLDIVTDRLVPTVLHRDEVYTDLEACREAGADSLAYMGQCHAGSEVLLASQKQAGQGWVVPRVLSSGYLGTIPGLGHGFELEMFEGWGGIDQYDERNPVFVDVVRRFEARYRRDGKHCYVSQGYDMAITLAKAISMAYPLTPGGIRNALERVRMLPAATGGPGNWIGFGPHDHRGYKGQYIVIREVKDGQNVTVFDPVFMF